MVSMFKSQQLKKQTRVFCILPCFTSTALATKVYKNNSKPFIRVEQFSNAKLNIKSLEILADFVCTALYVYSGKYKGAAWTQKTLTSFFLPLPPLFSATTDSVQLQNLQSQWAHGRKNILATVFSSCKTSLSLLLSGCVYKQLFRGFQFTESCILTPISTWKQCGDNEGTEEGDLALDFRLTTFRQRWSHM